MLERLAGNDALKAELGTALLRTLDQLCSAVLRLPAYGQEQCGGLTPAGAAKILNADARARKSLTGNGNLRLNVAVLAGEIA